MNGTCRDQGMRTWAVPATPPKPEGALSRSKSASRFGSPTAAKSMMNDWPVPEYVEREFRR